MVVCGIKKYDDLPARVEWIDVDYLRFIVYSYDNPTFLGKIMRNISIWRFDGLIRRGYAVEGLEKAYRIYNKKVLRDG